eukprot:497853-Pyramimonas_sp.AAC.1
MGGGDEAAGGRREEEEKEELIFASRVLARPNRLPQRLNDGPRCLQDGSEATERHGRGLRSCNMC